MTYLSKSILNEVLTGRCKNGLIYYQSDKKLNHLSAIQYCLDLRHHDLVGWRFPTPDELSDFLILDSPLKILDMIAEYWVSQSWQASQAMLSRDCSPFNSKVRKKIIAVYDISRFQEIL